MLVPAIRFWQPLFILQHLLPFIGTFEDVQDEVGAGVVVSSLCENPSLRGPLSHEWVSIALLFFFRLFLVFRIFVVVFVSAPASVSICSLSLSLSLSLSVLALDVSVYLSTFFARLRSNVFAKKRQVLGCCGHAGLFRKRPASICHIASLMTNISPARPVTSTLLLFAPCTCM